MTTTAMKYPAPPVLPGHDLKPRAAKELAWMLENWYIDTQKSTSQHDSLKWLNARFAALVNGQGQMSTGRSIDPRRGDLRVIEHVLAVASHVHDLNGWLWPKVADPLEWMRGVWFCFSPSSLSDVEAFGDTPTEDVECHMVLNVVRRGGGRIVWQVLFSTTEVVETEMLVSKVASMVRGVDVSRYVFDAVWVGTRVEAAEHLVSGIYDRAVEALTEAPKD